MTQKQLYLTLTDDLGTRPVLLNENEICSQSIEKLEPEQDTQTLFAPVPLTLTQRPSHAIVTQIFWQGTNLPK